MPTLPERLTAVEINLAHNTVSLHELKDSVDVGFNRMAESIREVSPNGQTTTLVAMAKEFGDPESRVAIKQMVRGHQHRVWLNRPFIKFAEIAAYGLTGAGALALLHRLIAGTWF